MKTLLTLIAAVSVFAGAAFADPVNKLCPVSGKAGDPEVTYAYNKKVSFCCDKCKAKFDKDPASFGEKIAAYKADSGKCILSGKDIDKAQTSDYKAAVTTCCEKCKAKVEAEPDKFIAKALKKS
jgi:hypothetical protein